MLGGARGRGGCAVVVPETAGCARLADGALTVGEDRRRTGEREDLNQYWYSSFTIEMMAKARADPPRPKAAWAALGAMGRASAAQRAVGERRR